MEQNGWVDYILGQKSTYIFLTIVLNTKVLLAKTFTEMKFLPQLMMFGVISLLMVFSYKLMFHRPKIISVEKEEYEYDDYINSMSVILTVYGFIQNLFPVATQMEDGSIKNVMTSVGLGLSFCFFSYLTLTILAINLFGP